MPERNSFSKTRVIIAEGEEDAAFSRAMLASHADTLPEFDVSPAIDIGGVGGNTGFKPAVMRADALAGFSQVRDVVIIGDNDDDPNRAFGAIARQIREAKESGDLSSDWAIPTAPFMKALGNPSVSVWLWPANGQAGCLETLLWAQVQSQTKYNDVVICVNQAIQCAGINEWPLSKLDKSRIRCFVGLYLKKNPAVALARLWTQHPSLIPIRSRQFTPFLDFLRNI